MRRKGIDVSYANGRINWRKVKDDGIAFAMIRAGFGDDNIDQEFERNIRECNRHRIPVGVYWFSYAYTKQMARDEARDCIEAIRKYKIDEPVAFDYEGASINYARQQGVNVTKELVTDFTEEFCREIKRAGYEAMYYAGLYNLEEYFDRERLRDYELWLARYANRSGVDDVSMWQYSNIGRVRGINGDVDLNYSYRVRKK